jgi:hypothetical protein
VQLLGAESTLSEPIDGRFGRRKCGIDRHPNHIQCEGDSMGKLLAALTVFAAVAGAPAVSQATTVHITYTGTVTYISDPAGVSGFSLGDPITGSMTINFDGIYYDACCNPTSQTRFFEGSGKATVNTVEISSSVPYPNEYANGIFYPTQDQYELWEFQTGDPSGSASVQFLRNSIAPLILSLEPNLANLHSLVAAGLLSVSGDFAHGGPGEHWDIEFVGDSSNASVTLTPIPAALPLFASALGGLGLFGWHRRRP